MLSLLHSSETPAADAAALGIVVSFIGSAAASQVLSIMLGGFLT